MNGSEIKKGTEEFHPLLDRQIAKDTRFDPETGKKNLGGVAGLLAIARGKMSEAKLRRLEDDLEEILKRVEESP